MSQWRKESEETTSKTNLEKQDISTTRSTDDNGSPTSTREILPDISYQGSVTTPSLHSGPPNNFATLITPVSSHQPDAGEHDYPEGGLRAWLVVLGSFAGMTACFGMMNTIGTFEAYISTHQLEGYSPSAIGWIFGIYVFLAFFSGILIGPIFDAYGPRILVMTGTVCLVGGTVGVAFSTGKKIVLIIIL